LTRPNSLSSPFNLPDSRIDEFDCALKASGIRVVFMNRYMPFIVVGAAALTALASGTLLTQTMQPHRLMISADEAVSARSPTESVHVRGNPNALVTLEDVKSDQVRERLEFDQARAKSLRIKTAPTLFVDKREMGMNDRTPEGVRRLVDEALKAQTSTLEQKGCAAISHLPLRDRKPVRLDAAWHVGA
jgi:hypothetical protein